MKRASYRFGVEWIAMNDDSADMDEERIRGFVSTLLLADLFEVEPSKVAADILAYKLKHPETFPQGDTIYSRHPSEPAERSFVDKWTKVIKQI